MLKKLEHHEHAEHLAHAAHGADGHAAAPRTGIASPQVAALLVACLAAGLAISEQGAKHAEIKVQAYLVSAVDAWAQYQAKSVRSTVARDTVLMLGALDAPATPEVADRRKKAVEELRTDIERYDKDPRDGRDVIAHRAHEFEHARDHALEQTHAYHNGSAMMELGIVLSTASAIIGSRMLVVLAMTMGALGVLCAVAGYVKPEWGAF